MAEQRWDPRGSIEKRYGWLMLVMVMLLMLLMVVILRLMMCDVWLWKP